MANTYMRLMMVGYRDDPDGRVLAGPVRDATEEEMRAAGWIPASEGGGTDAKV